jgi:hypothetical protein
LVEIKYRDRLRKLLLERIYFGIDDEFGWEDS